MSLAQPDVIDSCAYWIAAHALALLLVIFLTALGVIAALWHLFETRRPELSAHPGGWSRRVLERPFAQSLRQRYPRVWRFFGARFASESYLGLNLTIGLLVTLAAMLGFGALADAVTDREELTEFDQQLAMSLHQNGTIDQVRIFEAITRFGDYRTLVCLGLAVSLTLLISRRWLLLVGWVVALTGSGFLNAMLKALFHRARPVFANPWLTESGWSFPSGHAMGSLVTYGMLAYILIVAWRVRFPRTIVAVSVALVLAIGFSRIYLGVHFFSDVAAGYAAAMMWLAICVSGCEVARRRKRMRRFLSQLLTNERSKVAIEVALLSRRSFRNGGLPAINPRWNSNRTSATQIIEKYKKPSPLFRKDHIMNKKEDIHGWISQHVANSLVSQNNRRPDIAVGHSGSR